MFVFSSMLIYFCSIIIAISAMTFVVLLTVVNEVSRRRQLFFLMVFCASNFCVETLYLWMTIQDSLLHYYHYNILLRIADISLYTMQTYSWCRYLLFFRSDNDSVHIGKFCSCISALILLIGIFNYSFLINDKFLFISNYGIILEMLTSALLSVMLIYTAYSRRNAVHSRYFKQFNLFITGMLVLVQWWTGITMVIETYLGLPFEAHEYMTGSLQQMLIILAFAIYVYKTDYSGRILKEEIISRLNKAEAAGVNPSEEANTRKEYVAEVPAEDAPETNKALQSGSAAERSNSVTEDDKALTIEELFNIKHLTNREREVAMLAYSGMTNPDIADKLFISEHTVKRHMHSIFGKLEISARIELVHLMNGK